MRPVAVAEAHAIVGEDGRFELSCRVLPQFEYCVRVYRHDLVERQRAFGPYDEGAVVDLGDIVMGTGAIVSTRLVDQRGAAVAGVHTVVMLDVAPGRNDSLMQRTDFTAFSGADGTLDWQTALLPGRYRVMWCRNGIPDEQMATWMEIPDLPAWENMLVWPVADDRQTIRGVVMDAEGRPVPRLDLGAVGGGTRGNAETGDDGTFVMARVGPYEEQLRGPVTFGLPRPIEGYALAREATCHWGDRDVRLEVGAAAVLDVSAIDPRTGTLVTDFAVACAALFLEHGSEPSVAWPRTERRQDGSLRLALANVPHLVQVLPRDAALAPSLQLRWEPSAGSELAVPLCTTRTAVVRVVDGAGAPVTGTEVWSLQPIEAREGIAGAGEVGAPEWEDIDLPDRRWFGVEPGWRWARSGIDDAPIDHATTDADGRVRLRVPERAGAVIAAYGPGHIPRAIATDVPVPSEIELRVQRGSGVRVEISPPEVVARLLAPERRRQIDALRTAWPGSGGVELWIARVAHEQDRAHPQECVRVAVEGSVVEAVGLPSGTYDLCLSGDIANGRLDGIGVHDQFATVELPDDEVLVVPLDLHSWVPGRIAGQVLVNEEPWALGVGSLEQKPRGGHSSVKIETDAEGRFEVEVLPGDYRLRLRYRAGPGNTGYWFAPETWPVDSGRTTRAVFDVRRVKARVRVTTAEGTAAQGLQVTMDCASEPRGWQAWTTDADGWIEIDPAPLVPFALIVATPNRTGTLADGLPGAPRDALLGPFTVPAVGISGEFRAGLPAGWR